jgi:hypothetical protein
MGAKTLVLLVTAAPLGAAPIRLNGGRIDLPAGLHLGSPLAAVTLAGASTSLARGSSSRSAARLDFVPVAGPAACGSTPPRGC